ncbi:MAG: ATP-binding protein [Methylotenera sp.]
MPTLIQLFRQLFNDSDRLMALMLLSLHALIIWGEAGDLHKALFLCHYGLFLMWQPLMRQTNKLSWQAVLIIVVGAVAAMSYSNWWFTAFWIAGLFALIGGRIFSTESTRSRLPNILAAAYLLAILVLWVVPKLLKANDDLAAAEFVLMYLLPFLPVTILFISKNKLDNNTPNIDFFYTLLIFLLTLIVILGSFAIGVIWQIHYIKLLIVAAISLAATLVALSWLWNPSATFSGLELLMSRYLLSIGLPFEQWIRKIARHADYEPTADSFLQASMSELVALNWVSGIKWQIGNDKFQIGETTQFISTFTFHKLHLSLYSRWQFSPAMYLHVQLLTQILGEFYEAKLREETTSQNIYMQTFYETGSRLTHDIKNILQSMGTLSAAALQNEAGGKDAEEDARLIELIKKQLPRLNQRLTTTLTKLARPSNEKKQQAKVNTWWKDFKQLNSHYASSQHQIQFEAPETMPKADIDPDVLDSIVDNLIQNALEKARLEVNTQIQVTLMPSEKFCIEVSDTGSAMPVEVADKLFKTHISSKNGLGVGLYHAAQQAKQAGYLLSLIENHDGAVRFRLEMIDNQQTV